MWILWYKSVLNDDDEGQKSQHFDDIIHGCPPREAAAPRPGEEGRGSRSNSEQIASRQCVQEGPCVQSYAKFVNTMLLQIEGLRFLPAAKPTGLVSKGN